MRLTEAQIERVDSIPNTEIATDLNNARNELKQYEDEQNVLSNDPVRNKVRLYMLNPKIRKGYEFVSELNQMLQYRGQTFNQDEINKGL